MFEHKIGEFKVEQIYIASEDSNLVLKAMSDNEEELKQKLKTCMDMEHFLEQDEMKIVSGISLLNLETLNIIEKNIKEGRRLKSDNLTFKKLNKEKLANLFKCLGLNIIYCLQVAENIFNRLNILLKIKYEGKDLTNYLKSTVVIKQTVFYIIAKEVIKALTGVKCRIRKYFSLSYLIINKSIPVIILVGGTSGTGKSTVSSLLASRLSISTVLSTDHIRHILRNFLSKEEIPVLFASTYDAWKYLPEDKIKNLPMNKRILQGYLEQSKIVGEKLEKVIDNFLHRQESVVIEGVHLTIDTIRNIMKKHKYTFPFLVHIEKAEKHKERFAFRSKLMTLDPRYNKYVENFEHIRIIQSYLVKKADRYLLPKIDNTNVDKSIGMIQETILRSFKDIYSNNIPNYDEAKDSFHNYFNNFSKFTKTLMSSKEANILIFQKVNKNFLLDKFFAVDEVKTQDNILSTDKKECLSDDEVISQRKDTLENLKKKNENKENKENNGIRVNYRTEGNNNRNKSAMNIGKGISIKQLKSRKRGKSDLDFIELNRSDSINKDNGSIDSESGIERIKVINETEDEIDSAEDDQEFSNKSNVSCGSVSEEERRDVLKN